MARPGFADAEVTSQTVNPASIPVETAKLFTQQPQPLLQQSAQNLNFPKSKQDAVAQPMMARELTGIITTKFTSLVQPTIASQTVPAEVYANYQNQVREAAYAAVGNQLTQSEAYALADELMKQHAGKLEGAGLKFTYNAWAQGNADAGTQGLNLLKNNSRITGTSEGSLLRSVGDGLNEVQRADMLRGAAAAGFSEQQLQDNIQKLRATESDLEREKLKNEAGIIVF